MMLVRRRLIDEKGNLQRDQGDQEDPEDPSYRQHPEGKRGVISQNELVAFDGRMSLKY